jgi:hypothetical protein
MFIALLCEPPSTGVGFCTRAALGCLIVRPVYCAERCAVVRTEWIRGVPRKPSHCQPEVSLFGSNSEERIFGISIHTQIGKFILLKAEKKLNITWNCPQNLAALSSVWQVCRRRLRGAGNRCQPKILAAGRQSLFCNPPMSEWNFLEFLRSFHVFAPP